MAQGPEEKRGLSGRNAGFVIVIIIILTDMCLSLGRGVPATSLQVISKGLKWVTGFFEERLKN